MNADAHIDSIEQQANEEPLAEVGSSVETDDRLQKLRREPGEASTEGTVEEALANLGEN